MWSLMDSYELLLAMFADESAAGVALEDLKAREEDGELRIFNAAVIAKDEAGRTILHEDQDVGPGLGTLFGALVGGLIGMLGGPGGAMVGAAAGAATGGLVAGRSDMGFDDKFLKELKMALKPGVSALLLLVEERFAGEVAHALKMKDGRLVRHALRKDLIERLRSNLDE
jgi:uncharacterized membrane protein